MRTAHPDVWTARQRRDVEALRNTPRRCVICDSTMLDRSFRAHFTATHPGAVRHEGRYKAFVVASALSLTAIFIVVFILLLPLVGPTYSFFADFFFLPGFLAWWGLRILWLRVIEPRYVARARTEWQALHSVLMGDPIPPDENLTRRGRESE